LEILIYYTNIIRVLIIFWFGWNNKVRKLRKRWDRCREKALKKKGSYKRNLLEKLDLVETKLKTIEEQNLNRATRARMSKEIEIDLEEIKELLKEEPETQVTEAQ
jgi:flagellar biosynthesis/type III secretory pathway M-ring protein FliF/YscJ